VKFAIDESLIKRNSDNLTVSEPRSAEPIPAISTKKDINANSIGSKLKTTLSSPQSTDVPSHHDALLEETSANPSLREIAMTAGMSLLVSLRVNNLLVDAVIDTGAQVSVISKTFANKLDVPPSSFERVKLKNAQKGSSMEGKVAKGLVLHIGTQTYPWDLVVADISDDLILGYDFLKFNHSVLNLNENSLVLNGESIPAHTKRENGTEFKISRVLVQKKIVIPPFSLKIIKARMTHPTSSEYMLTPIRNAKDVLVPSMVVKGDSTVPVCLLNDSSKYKVLKKDQLLATAVEVDEVVSELNSDESSESEMAHPEFRPEEDRFNSMNLHYVDSNLTQHVPSDPEAENEKCSPKVKPDNLLSNLGIGFTGAIGYTCNSPVDIPEVPEHCQGMLDDVKVPTR